MTDTLNTDCNVTNKEHTYDMKFYYNYKSQELSIGGDVEDSSVGG